MMTKQHKWHKVEDKLPTHGQSVLTWNEDMQDMVQARYSDTNKWQELDMCGDFFDFPPTHWMELPEPPKETT